MIFRSLFYKLVDYIFPTRCISCKTLIQSGDGLCSVCFSELDFISKPYCEKCGKPFEFNIEDQLICVVCLNTKPPYVCSRSLFRFNERSKKLLHDFKYNDAMVNSKVFARMIISRYKQEFSDVSLVVPVPMNRFKRLFRRYNPAQILAKDLASILGVPMVSDLLIKKSWTKSQVGLSKEEREQNLKGSIALNPSYDITKKTILLVDDVRTTGSTINICSRVLKDKQNVRVKVATISRT